MEFAEIVLHILVEQPMVVNLVLHLLDVAVLLLDHNIALIKAVNPCVILTHTDVKIFVTPMIIVVPVLMLLELEVVVPIVNLMELV